MMNRYDAFAAASPEVADLTSTEADALFRDVFTARIEPRTDRLGPHARLVLAGGSGAKRRRTVPTLVAAAAIITVFGLAFEARREPAQPVASQPTSLDLPVQSTVEPLRMLPSDMAGLRISSGVLSHNESQNVSIWIFARPQPDGSYTDRLHIQRFPADSTEIDPGTNEEQYEVSTLDLGDGRTADILYDVSNEGLVGQFRDLDGQVVWVRDDHVTDLDAERRVIETQTLYVARANPTDELGLAPELNDYEQIYRSSAGPDAGIRRTVQLIETDAPQFGVEIVTETGAADARRSMMMDDLVPITIRNGRPGYRTSHQYPESFGASASAVALGWEESPGQWVSVGAGDGWDIDRLTIFAESLEEVDANTWNIATGNSPSTTEAGSAVPEETSVNGPGRFGGRARAERRYTLGDLDIDIGLGRAENSYEVILTRRSVADVEESSGESAVEVCSGAVSFDDTRPVEHLEAIPLRCSEPSVELAFDAQAQRVAAQTEARVAVGSVAALAATSSLVSAQLGQQYPIAEPTLLVPGSVDRSVVYYRRGFEIAASSIAERFGIQDNGQPTIAAMPLENLVEDQSAAFDVLVVIGDDLGS